MKAIVYTKYGQPDVLKLKEVAKPTPKDNEVLVKIHASSVNYSDWALVRGKPFILRLMTGGVAKPKHPILGKDIAGRVEAIGKNVTQFQPGDEVYGDLAYHGFGAFAEYVAVPEEAVTFMPSNLDYEQAATVPEAAVVALQGLRNLGKIKPGQKVLIHGASGGIGTFAVQIAKSFGAEVTGVCSTRNLDLVRSLGADQVIDYTKDDFVKNGPKYDLILGTVGYRSIFDYRKALKPKGIYVMTGGSLKQVFEAMILGPLLSSEGGKQLTNLSNNPNQEDLDFMREFLEAGKVVPVINKYFPLGETAQAVSYYGTGRAQGKVVIRVEHSNI